jgi:hypothetical protein
MSKKRVHLEETLALMLAYVAGLRIGELVRDEAYGKPELEAAVGTARMGAVLGVVRVAQTALAVVQSAMAAGAERGIRAVAGSHLAIWHAPDDGLTPSGSTDVRSSVTSGDATCSSSVAYASFSVSQNS